MKFKKALLVVFACILSLVMTVALLACGNDDKKDETPGAVTVSEITLKTTAQVEVGSTENVLTQIKYSDGTTKKVSDSSVEWLTSNASVATVNRGIVTAVAAGEAKITAKSGNVTSGECTVTVVSGRVVSIVNSEGTAVTTLTLDKDTNDNAQLTAKVTRDGTELSGQEIVWASEDTSKVTVDATGKVTALLDTDENTPVKVTATIKDTTYKAEVLVTVTWANKDNYTFDASTYEQNKSPAGIWNYWGDQNWNWTMTTIHAAYVDGSYETDKTPATGYQYIGANKVTIEYKVDDPTKNVASVQLFYRSAGTGEKAKLLTNHNYELKLKLETSSSGVVSLNDFTKLPGGHKDGVEVGEIAGEEDDYLFEVTAGEVNELTVRFRHGDTGAIYKNGVYDNIESAIQLCIGKLAGDHVVVSVYDLQYKDLGEAEKKWVDNEPNLADYVAPLPDMGDAQAIGIPAPTETGSEYTINSAADNKSHTIAYTNVEGGSYINLAFDLTGTDAKNCNTLSFKIKNNGENNITLRFDIECPTGIQRGENGNSKDCATGSAATDGATPNTGTVWDGTTVAINAGQEITLYISYDPDTDRGDPTSLLVYCETFYWDNDPNNSASTGRGSYSGNFTLSEFKLADVEG